MIKPKPTISDLLVHTHNMIGNLDFALNKGVTKDHARLLIWQTKEMLLNHEAQLKELLDEKTETD